MDYPRYKGKPLPELKKILSKLQNYEDLIDEDGNSIVLDNTAEKKWLRKRIDELENPPKLAKEESDSDDEYEKESEFKSLRKGGRTRKQRKTRKSKKHLKKTHKRRHSRK